MDFDYMHKCFPNYTREMWEGVKPSRKGFRVSDGNETDHWNCERGTADTYNGQVLLADFELKTPGAWLFLCRDKLQVTRNLSRCLRQYSLNMPNLKSCHPVTAMVVEPLDRLDARKMIESTDFPGCAIWEQVKARALQMIDAQC